VLANGPAAASAIETTALHVIETMIAEPVASAADVEGLLVPRADRAVAAVQPGQVPTGEVRGAVPAARRWHAGSLVEADLAAVGWASGRAGLDSADPVAWAACLALAAQVAGHRADRECSWPASAAQCPGLAPRRCARSTASST
jgi:hypothetical protein